MEDRAGPCQSRDDAGLTSGRVVCAPCCVADEFHPTGNVFVDLYYAMIAVDEILDTRCE